MYVYYIYVYIYIYKWAVDGCREKLFHSGASTPWSVK